MTADLLANWTNFVLIHDTPAADLLRYVIATLGITTSILLAKLYLSHRTGRMTVVAGYAAVMAFATIGWAQLIAASSEGLPDDVSVFNLVVLSVVVTGLVGTLQAFNVRLFRNRS